MLRDEHDRASRVGGAGRRDVLCRRALVAGRCGRQRWRRGLCQWGVMVRRCKVTRRPAALQDGNTALDLAARGGHKDMVVVLLDRGAYLETKPEVSAAAV